jgi:hypothetical protein
VYKNSTFTVVDAFKQSRTIKLVDVPDVLNEDALELLIENHLGRPFSAAPDIVLDHTRKEASVTFSNPLGMWSSFSSILHIAIIFSRGEAAR